MKRFFLLLVSAALFASAGCGDTTTCPETDLMCYDICFWVADAEGNNLMDPETEGNLLDKGVYAEYRGEIYNLITEAPETRYNMPHWKGLRTHSGYSPEFPSVMLKFGQFSPEGEYKGETFTIHWGDGTSDEVKFDMYVTWKECKATVHRKLWFNGQSIPGTDATPYYLIQVLK